MGNHSMAEFVHRNGADISRRAVILGHHLIQNVAWLERAALNAGPATCLLQPPFNHGRRGAAPNPSQLAQVSTRQIVLEVVAQKRDHLVFGPGGQNRDTLLAMMP